MPDYVIYVMPFPEWILSKEYIPDVTWAREFFGTDGMAAMCQHVKQATAMVVEADFTTADSAPSHYPANHLVAICHPDLMRFELKVIMEQLPPAFYGLFAPSPSGGYYNVISEMEMTSPTSARYSDGSRWEQLEIINGAARFKV